MLIEESEGSIHSVFAGNRNSIFMVDDFVTTIPSMITMKDVTYS